MAPCGRQPCQGVPPSPCGSAFSAGPPLSGGSPRAGMGSLRRRLWDLGAAGGRPAWALGPRLQAMRDTCSSQLGGLPRPGSGQEDLQPTPLDRWGVMTEQGAGPRWLLPGLEGPARTLSPPQPHPQPGSELCLAPPPRQAYLWGQAHLRDRLTCDRAPHSHRGAAAHR